MMSFIVKVAQWWNPSPGLAEMQTASALASLRMAEFVAERARLYCPVLSGDLKRSIQVISAPDNLTHWVVATMPYAEPVEFGYTHYLTGRRVPPQPFMRMALQDGADRFPQIIGDARVLKGFHRGAVMGIEFKAA